MALPRALLCDLDGTLIDSESIHAESIARGLADHGVELTVEERAYVVGHAWEDIYRELRLADRCSLSVEGVQAAAVIAKDRMAEEGQGIRVLAGVQALFARFTRLGIPCAIVTGSCQAEVAQVWADLGIAEHVRFVLASDDVARGKPAPDGYLQAAKRLAVDVRRCIVIEDSTPGIASARAAGAFVVATRECNRPPGHPDHQDQSGADAFIDGLHEIDDALLRGLFPD